MTEERTPEPAAAQITAEPTVVDVAERHQFEIRVSGRRAGLTRYVDHEGQRIFFHTEVVAEYEGQGLAGILVRAALDATREAGLRIVPVCPYVAVFVRRNDDWADLVDAVTPAAIETVERAVRA